MNRRDFLNAVGLITAGVVTDSLNTFASNNDPLSKRVEDEIRNRGGIIEWDRSGSEVIYQSDEARYKHGSIKEVIVANLDISSYNYNAQSGGNNGLATRYYVTLK